MPVGTVNMEAQRYDLKTLPPVGKEGDATYEEGGYIMARPLPYGMKLDRRDKATRMKLEQKMQQNRRGRRQPTPQSDDDVQSIELDMQSLWAAQHDFGYCVVDHNITDVNGTKLDLVNPMTFKILDPRVGSEIERILSDLNDDEVDEDELEDFTKQHTVSSLDEKDK